MDLDRGYGLTDRVLAELNLLLAVAGFTDGRVGFPGMATGRQADQATALLVADGVVDDYQDSEGHELALTAEGGRVADNVHERLNDQQGRYLAVRAALLRWLGDEYLADSPTLGRWKDSFLDSRWGTFLGESFNDNETSRGMKSLLDDGDVAGSESWGPVISRPELTAQGRARVFREPGSGGAADGAQERRVSGDTHFHGPVTGAQVNHGTTGSVQNVQVTGDQLDGIRRLVAAVLTDTALAARVEVGRAVAVVEDAVEEDPVAPTRLRRVVGSLGDKVLAAAVAAGSAPAWQALGHQIQAAAQALPH